MQLKSILIKAEEHTENFLNFPFGFSAHHVTNIFLHFLAKSFTLGPVRLVQINGDMHLPVDRVECKFWKSTKACELTWGGFDFKKYKASTPEDRQDQILDLIVDCLSYIVKGDSARLDEINQAAEKTRDAKFEVKQALIKLNCKNNTDGCRFEFFRTFGLNYGETWSVEICDSDDNKKRLWLSGRPDYLDRSDHYRKSIFEKSCLYLVDQDGDRQLEIDYDNAVVTRCQWVSGNVSQDKTEPRYERIPIDVASRAQTAFSRAGHAYKNGDFQRVVTLMQPYSKYLSQKQQTMLESAKKQLAEG